MNNEEKILEMLTQLQADMTQLKQNVGQQGELLGTVDERSQQTADLLAKVDERSQRTAILMEEDMMWKLQTLYEGHGTIMETLDKLTTKDRFEKLEDEIIVLKTAFKSMNQRIAELEKAQ